VTGIATAKASRYPVVTHWMFPSLECSLTASVCSARVTIVESRIAATPPTISASNAPRTCGGSFVSVGARSTVVPVIGSSQIKSEIHLLWRVGLLAKECKSL
jgi:hypothetical protein